MSERKTYTEEFKREAVRLAQESDNVSAVARDLGIDHSVLRKWKRWLHGQSNPDSTMVASSVRGYSRNCRGACAVPYTTLGKPSRERRRGLMRLTSSRKLRRVACVKLPNALFLKAASQIPSVRRPLSLGVYCSHGSR